MTPPAISTIPTMSTVPSYASPQASWDSQSAGDNSSAYSHGSYGEEYTSHAYKARERNAHSRALKLLDHNHAGDSYRPKTAKEIRKAAVHDHKQKKANNKAAVLMAQNHAGRAYASVKKMSPKEIREAKLHEFKLRNGELSFAPPHFTKVPTPPPTQPRLEKKATTTRKIPEPEERLPGMKCQIEIERERIAEMRALRMIDTPEGMEVIV